MGSGNIKIWVAQYIEYITIDICGPSEATCQQDYTFTACASSNVDTAIDVDFTWIGDLGGVINGSITISGTSGTTSASGNINCLGEYASTFQITNITPSSYNSQEYIAGQSYTGGSCPC